MLTRKVTPGSCEELPHLRRGGEVLHLVDEESGGEGPEVGGGGENQLRGGEVNLQ